MLLVVSTDPGTVEINHLWLPTWLGLNAQLLERVSQKIRPTAELKVLTPSMLYQLHRELIELLVKEFPAIRNLGTMLRSIESVQLE